MTCKSLPPALLWLPANLQRLGNRWLASLLLELRLLSDVTGCLSYISSYLCKGACVFLVASSILWLQLSSMTCVRRLTDCFPLPRSISQNSSVLHEEDDEKSCSESEIRISRRKSPRHHEEVMLSFCLKGFEHYLCFSPPTHPGMKIVFRQHDKS